MGADTFTSLGAVLHMSSLLLCLMDVDIAVMLCSLLLSGHAGKCVYMCWQEQVGLDSRTLEE